MGFYGGALLNGLGAGGGVLANSMIQGIDRQQRWDDQQRNQLALEDERQKHRMELAQARGGRGGPSPLSEEQEAALMKMSVPEYRKFVEMEKTGSDEAYRHKFTTLDDNYGEMQGSALPPDFKAFVERKRAERAKMIETDRYTNDIDKIAKARGTDQETELIGKAATGDRKAGEGVLYAHGKDPMESAAKAKEREAEARKDDRTDPNAKKGGGGGATGGVQSTKVDENGKIILVMKDGSIRETGRTASSFGKDVASLIAKLSKDDYKFSRLSPEEQRLRAVSMLVEQPVAAAPPAAQPKPQPNVADMRTKANAAIASGKSRAAVAARFKELTGEDL